MNWNYYKKHIGPFVNGLLLLVPASYAFIDYMAEATQFYNNALHRKNNLAELSSMDMVSHRMPMIITIFALSSFITSRSTGDNRMGPLLILIMLGVFILVGITAHDHTAVEILMMASIATVSGLVGHMANRLTRRCS